MLGQEHSLGVRGNEEFMKIEHSKDGTWRVGRNQFLTREKAEEFMRGTGGPNWNQAKRVVLMSRMKFMLGMIIVLTDKTSWVIQDFGINSIGDPQIKLFEIAGDKPAQKTKWVSLVEFDFSRVEKIETDTYFTQKVKRGGLRKLDFSTWEVRDGE